MCLLSSFRSHKTITERDQQKENLLRAIDQYNDGNLSREGFLRILGAVRHEGWTKDQTVGTAAFEKIEDLFQKKGSLRNDGDPRYTSSPLLLTVEAIIDDKGLPLTEPQRRSAKEMLTSVSTMGRAAQNLGL